MSFPAPDPNDGFKSRGKIGVLSCLMAISGCRLFSRRF